MIRFIKKIYLTDLFFIVLGIIAGLFAISFFIHPLFRITQALLILVAVISVVDVFFIFQRGQSIIASRHAHNMLSLNDENTIRLIIENRFRINTRLKIIDELPGQFQIRDFAIHLKMKPFEEKTIKYGLTPKTRGEYHFGNINFFVRSSIGLIQRKETVPQEQMMPVYPSIIQMKKYELHALSSISLFQGVKKLRKLGHSYEFEQIKNYVVGDDPRSINWKASSRTGNLMVNQYEDERYQQVYSVIDKSRSVKMPFNGLSLLDYAINTSLVISNVALQKHDRAGLFTFSDKIGTVIKADNTGSQLNKILTALYNEKENPLEANYELFYSAIRNMVRVRSLLFLYTNFESIYSLRRVLPFLRRLNNFHLLVVMFFDNSELIDYMQEESHDLLEVYQKTMARKFIYEKDLIIEEMRKHGIQSIKSKPEDLSIKTVNKYLELKSRGMI
jgi:uncharacterized protein (DUF58 family)